MDNRGTTQIRLSGRRVMGAFAIVTLLTILAGWGKALCAGLPVGVALLGLYCLIGLTLYFGVLLGGVHREEGGEAHFRKFMDQYPTVAFLKDRAGRLVYLNDAYCQAFQIQPEQRLYKLDSEVMPQATAVQIRADDLKVLESKCGLQFEEAIPDQSNVLRHWLVFKFPVSGKASEVFLGGVAVEISGMVAAQAALRESESRYRQIVEYASDLIVRCDKSGRMTYANEMSARILKISSSELLGRRALSLIRPDARRRIRSQTWHHLSQRVTDFYLEVPVVAGDRSEIWLGQNIRVLRNGDSIQGFQAICRDITDRRRMEEELRLSEERFRLLYENGPVAYHQLDRDGVIQRVNRAECEMLGYSEAELVGRPVLDLVAPEDREIARAAVRDKFNEKTPLLPFTRVYLRSDGRRLRLEIHENLLRDHSGAVMGIHSVLLDVTQRHLTETLDRDRFRVSEMMAQQQPLDRILPGITAMVCHQDETLTCIPIRLNEDCGTGAQQLEPVCADPRLEPLCQVIRDVGNEVLSPWLRDSFQVSYHAVAELFGTPASSEFAQAITRLGTRACWSMPIVSSCRQPLGLLLVFSPRDGEAPPQMQQMLEAVSRISALAIEHRCLTDLQAFQASHDSLTRLPNRSTFEARLQDAIVQARDHGEELALFFVDLDKFKEVNDTFGHSGGDELLRQVSARLRLSIRRTDLLARIGGDEFSVLVEGLRDTSDANRLAEAILRAFHTPFDIGGWKIQVTASIGISFYPRDGLDAPTLQRNSDTAMYRVKNTGKNSFRCFGSEAQTGAQLVV